ncbi:substrate-binding domain-containing protein [Acidothermaceae bacterium B102]|nr:substrate-binding domain-containing protein [Acidothermaceae bacterium B102]
MTLQTIADKVGVSRMTVSNAFSRPDQLSDELRTRVLAAADDLGYVGPDPSARALARGSTGAVGMLLTDSLGEAFTDSVATTFLASVADSLAEAGLALTLLTPAGTQGNVPARDVAMDGVLVYVCEPDSPDVEWLRKRRLPLVGVDQTPVLGTAHVNVDDRQGARAAAQHLVDLGHRRIDILTLGYADHSAFVDEPLAERNNFAGRQRMLGWLDALTAAGITPRVVLSPFRPAEAADEGARLILTGPDRPTGVLCFSDVYAASVVHAAHALGLRVPDDISVVGYDDNPLATRLDPPLTTVRQDIEAKGRLAVATLTAVLKARQDGTPEPTDHVSLPVELVVRGSSGPAPQR